MNELNPEIKSQIDVAAYFLAQENHSYDKLCWFYAKNQLRAQKDPRYNDEALIGAKAAIIYFESPPYDILCWLIAELDILIRLKLI